MIDPDVFSFEALMRHYRDCRRNKRNTANALAFEIDAETKLLELQCALRERTYRPGRSVCFITQGPKPREVFAADFRDRIVHHLLVHHQERLFEPHFIHDSYACRVGKGTLAANNRLTQFLHQVSANGRRSAWSLKLDVASFFPSIHKATLYRIIERRLVNPALLWLTRTVLFHDPTSDYRFQCRARHLAGPTSPDYPIPRKKSLFGGENVRGLPIGNLTSQFWANVYMNELDQFVKRELKCRHYLRYVDDLVLLANDRDTLLRWCNDIEQFLAQHLQLTLRPEMKIPVPIAHGIDFVGWRTWWNHRVPRRRCIANLERRVLKFQSAELRPSRTGGSRYVQFSGEASRGGMEQLLASLNSYSGHLCHGAAWRTWAALWRRHPWLNALFTCQGWRVEARWPKRVCIGSRSLHHQYAVLLRGVSENTFLFFEVGSFIEFYGTQRHLAQRVFGLRRAALPRACYAFTVGFPRRLACRYLRRALKSGFTVAQFAQVHSHGPWVTRQLRRLHLPG